MIGAGSVVTKDVKDFSLVYGNPAKFISWIDKKGNKLEFDKNNLSKCGNFRIEDDQLIEV